MENQQMSYNLDQHPGESGKARLMLGAAILLLALAFGIVRATAQKATTSIAPSSITPPATNSLFLVGRALGTQGYVCLPTATGVSWTVSGSRPQATLFAAAPGHSAQIMTHFLSPDANPNELAPKPLPFG